MKKAANQGKPWTEEEYALMLEMRRNGISCSEIAEKMGRTTYAIKAQCKIFFRGAKEAQAKENVELSEKIRKMTAEGMKEAQIAEELEISIGRLQSIKRKFNIIYSKSHRDAVIAEVILWNNKHTICWTCKNSMVNCKKPVDGWTAKQIPYKTVKGEDVPCWLVSKCPNYDPEPYAKKRGREK